MKTILALLLLLSVSVSAKEITIHTRTYGSGPQDSSVVTQAVETYPGSGLYHEPDYMAGYPTATPLWPRVVDVNCTEAPTGIICDGYNWVPQMGRGEYIFIRPNIIKPTPPVIIYQETPPK
jgi:hypothetical protein